MKFLLQFFTWWNGQTLGTRFHTWRNGEFVGEDDMANKYYRARNGDRRWVIYDGIAEPSAVPPEWHGWLHYTVDTPPTEEDYTPHEWQKAHQPNMTGTASAYRPDGSILSGAKRPQATGDYEAWQPE